MREAVFDQDLGSVQRFARRLSRHIQWARSQGIAQLIEEDRLDLRERLALSSCRRRWRRDHPGAVGTAVPVFLVGVQRSGTNMAVRGLERSPRFEVYHENSRRAYWRFLLRPDPVIANLIASSGHSFVLFKPLCDSHRLDQLLDTHGTGNGAKGLWVYRDVDGRVRSSTSKFGDNNLRVLREIAAGRGSHLWQAQRLSPDSLDFLRSFDFGSLTIESAAAMFWLVRNQLFFDLGLNDRDDVLLVNYEELVAQPSRVMQQTCRFLGMQFEADLIADIEDRSSDRAPVSIDPRIRERCDLLTRKLAAQLARQGDAAVRSRSQRDVGARSEEHP